MKYYFFGFLIFSGLSYGDTYICVPEAGAGVQHGGSAGIQANLYDVSDSKFIQSNESGNWLVKMLGNDQPIFDKCSGENLCESSRGYAGVFIRENDTGIFSATWIIVHNEQSRTMVVAKGRCSKL